MRYWYVFGLLILGSCRSDKTTCYQANLDTLKSSAEYRDVIANGKKQLPLLKGERGETLFRDTSYIDTAIIDDAVFFNDAKNKCVLLILQKTSKELYLDQIRIIQGTKLKGEWTFKQNRMPAVPEIIFTVTKTGSRTEPQNNSFEKLSKEGRLFVLDAGTVKYFNCDIDNKYWFDDN